jgi:hypothetical protein
MRPDLRENGMTVDLAPDAGCGDRFLTDLRAMKLRYRDPVASAAGRRLFVAGARARHTGTSSVTAISRRSRPLIRR